MNLPHAKPSEDRGQMQAQWLINMRAIERCENRPQKPTWGRGEGTQSEAEGHGKIKGSGYTACNSLSQHAVRMDTKI